MMKYRTLLVLFACLCMAPARAQNKYEREYRIRKSQFPEVALQFISEKLEGARRIRFYRETDSARTTYRSKFKQDRLRYYIGFDQQGKLEEIGFEVGAVDIPNESIARIKEDLGRRFQTYRIRKIQQQYPVRTSEAEAITLRNAFQNLLLPSLQYELVVAGREKKTVSDFEVLYAADGQFRSIRRSLPANYDRVLY